MTVKDRINRPKITVSTEVLSLGAVAPIATILVILWLRKQWEEFQSVSLYDRTKDKLCATGLIPNSRCRGLPSYNPEYVDEADVPEGATNIMYDDEGNILSYQQEASYAYMDGIWTDPDTGMQWLIEDLEQCYQIPGGDTASNRRFARLRDKYRESVGDVPCMQVYGPDYWK